MVFQEGDLSSLLPASLFFKGNLLNPPFLPPQYSHSESTLQEILVNGSFLTPPFLFVLITLITQAALEAFFPQVTSGVADHSATGEPPAFRGNLQASAKVAAPSITKVFPPLAVASDFLLPD